MYWVDCTISLLFDHQGAHVCCYRILLYPISVKYHQAVVNINLCEIGTLVSGEIRSFMDK